MQNADLKICHYTCVYMKIIVDSFTLKHLLLFEICTREICEKCFYKHSETMEYAKN